MRGKQRVRPGWAWERGDPGPRSNGPELPFTRGRPLSAGQEVRREAEGAAAASSPTRSPWAFSGGKGVRARNGDFWASGLRARAEGSPGHQGPEVHVRVCARPRVGVRLTADRTPLEPAGEFACAGRGAGGRGRFAAAQLGFKPLIKVSGGLPCRPSATLIPLHLSQAPGTWSPPDASLCGLLRLAEGLLGPRRWGVWLLSLRRPHFSWAHANSFFVICFLTHNPERVWRLNRTCALGIEVTQGLGKMRPGTAAARFLSEGTRSGLNARQPRSGCGWMVRVQRRRDTQRER